MCCVVKVVRRKQRGDSGPTVQRGTPEKTGFQGCLRGEGQEAEHAPVGHQAVGVAEAES